VTSTMEFTETLQDGFLKVLETGQRLTLEAVGAGVASLKDAMPVRPEMPFAAAMVTPEDAISASFRFADLLMKSQRSFLTEMAALAEPITGSAKKVAKG
jgi:hypothetical protein